MPATARTPEWTAAVAAIGQLTTSERQRLLGYLLDNLVNLPDLPDAAAERYAHAIELVGPADASYVDSARLGDIPGRERAPRRRDYCTCGGSHATYVDRSATEHEDNA